MCLRAWRTTIRQAPVTACVVVGDQPEPPTIVQLAALRPVSFLRAFRVSIIGVADEIGP
jgi:hypothetical protein